jgi:hypothetical protein
MICKINFGERLGCSPLPRSRLPRGVTGVRFASPRQRLFASVGPDAGIRHLDSSPGSVLPTQRVYGPFRCPRASCARAGQSVLPVGPDPWDRIQPELAPRVLIEMQLRLTSITEGNEWLQATM